MPLKFDCNYTVFRDYKSSWNPIKKKQKKNNKKLPKKKKKKKKNKKKKKKKKKKRKKKLKHTKHYENSLNDTCLHPYIRYVLWGNM